MIRRVFASIGLGFLILGGAGLSTARSAIPAPSAAVTGAAGPQLGTPLGISPDVPTADTGQDIRDIHGPIVIASRPSPWWYVGAGAVAAGLLAGMVFYGRWRKPIPPPHERALRALTEAGSMFEGDPREFSFAVSEIVRRYVEEAFHVRAAQRTTEELLADLMIDRSPVALHRTALGEFLHYCDLAKFAGWSLSPNDRVAMLASAETFVLTTAAPASPEQIRIAVIRGEGIA